MVDPEKLATMNGHNITTATGNEQAIIIEVDNDSDPNTTDVTLYTITVEENGNLNLRVD